MPIYAYKCESCGFAKDVLQKISDAPLSDCPSCGAGTFRKQVTAAGFHLKGSGWYVTDFRGGNQAGAKSEDKPAEAAVAKGQGGAEAPVAATTGSAPAPATQPATTTSSAPSAGADN